MELNLDSIDPIIYEGKVKFNVTFKTRLSKDELKAFLDKQDNGRIKFALNDSESTLLIFKVFNVNNK